MHAENQLLTALVIPNALIGLSYGQDILKWIFLSIIQGVTEWFPVSSSGHLVFFQELLSIRVPAAFDILIHAGSLIGLVFFIRKDLYNLLKALLKFDFSSKDGRTLTYLALGTVPIVILSLLLKEFIDFMFASLFFTGVAMLINGIILYLTKYSKTKSSFNASNASIIGIAQAFAIIPGISRMGITVSTALILGLDHEEAYRFSLLLSVLSIIGGCIFKINEAVSEIEPSVIFFSIVVTTTASIFALKFLKKYVARHSFYKFSYYCLIMGVMVLILDFFKFM